MKLPGNLRSLVIALMLAVAFVLVSGLNSFAQEENEQDWYQPFYYPYTPESEDWFQSLYHPYHPEQKGWFRPFIALRGEFDDNIFLTRDDEESDWITSITPGFVIEPQTNKHRIIMDYRADLNFFADNDGENNYNHTVNAAVELNFNKLSFNIADSFHKFSDRSGSEDTSRIDRNQNYLRTSATIDFNKMDLTLGYDYSKENYDSDDAIGSYKGVVLTYEDLERDAHEFSVETAIRMQPKTDLLFSGHYGFIEHDSGQKSDSDYLDFLLGLRGQPTAKCTIEANAGFRNQEFDDDEDFKSIVFNGSILERFSAKNSLRFDLLRTTEETIFQENAYYESTFLGLDWQHNFTDRLFSNVGFSYQHNYYNNETTVGGITDTREDDFFSGALGLRYKLTNQDIFADIKYQYRTRDSNFSTYDYKNNRISLGLTARF